MRNMQGIHYRVRAKSLSAHLYDVTLTIAQPVAEQIVRLPVWIPGSYLVREFARHLQRLQARQGRAQVAITQLDKCSWQVHSVLGKALVLNYQIYAFDNSVRTAWLSNERGFFNATSLCLQVAGQTEQAHQLTLDASGLPTSWQVATALKSQRVDARGWGRYQAANYDELVDSPVQLGAFWSAVFCARGVSHRLVVAGAAPSFDAARLLSDVQRICAAEIDFWHPAPLSFKAKLKPALPTATKPLVPQRDYVFMLNAVDQGYGGLEHRNSTALICPRANLPRLGQAPDSVPNDGYITLLGLFSHEYFHTWNVKRLRPAEFLRYDYGQENYTELLWFFEGFTSYYDDLLLRRTGLIDDETYLKLLAKTINLVLRTPGRKVQSVARASFDAWVKYYRSDENTGNATISYYTKGSLLALCLDLSLRQTSAGSLDNVMRALWQRCQGAAMTQDDLLAELAALSGQSYHALINQWAHGNADLPVKSLLALHGVGYHEERAELADQLGIRVVEQTGIQVKTVLRGGAAEQAGFAAGDEWLGVEIASGRGKTALKTGWRLSRLADLPLYLNQTHRFNALIARDAHLLNLAVRLPQDQTKVRLSVATPALVEQWLDSDCQLDAHA